MPSILILGLVVGTSLLIIGLMLGFWLGRTAVPPADVVDRQQFLAFLRNLSNWTSEFSGNLSRYQSKLTKISDRVASGHANVEAGKEVLELLGQVMQANQQLQASLDSAEHKLGSQTDRISTYLTEARTDGLTGLFNRRAFDKAADALFSDWKKKGQAFALGLIDIDNFKQINDTNGHQAGDAVLRHIAGKLQTGLPEAICVARYGGEEFAILTLAPVDTAAMTLDHLRDALSEANIRFGDHFISVTLSGGVSRIEASDTLGDLVRRADEALYAAKENGRNRIYVHTGAVCREPI